MSMQADNNVMTLQFSSRSENEALARVAIGSFVSQLDPMMGELMDLKTAVSEAVTNCIIHGYEHDPTGVITITAMIIGEEVELTISDEGRGIEDVELARQPLYTSKPDMERSGMGFTIIENFMDECEIMTELGIGTSIRMRKRIESKKALYN